MKNKNVVYIPLDNRPVCKKRVELLIQACGFNAILPDEAIIKTALDNQPYEDYPYGNVEKIKEWFKGLNHSQIDKYIICVDQIISGGLVHSRYDFDRTIEEDIKLIKQYFKILKDKNKQIILVDSLDRLAVTCSFASCDLKIYSGTRAFGSIDRKYVDVKKERFEDEMFKNYNLDINGNEIDYSKFNLTKEIRDNYVSNRKRKFLLSKYIVERINQFNSEGYDFFYMLGIDDSLSKNTIQTNEVAYFKEFIGKNNGLVFIGVDELPLMAVTKMTQKAYNIPSPSIKLDYIGGNYKIIGDPYDCGTIEEDMNKHLEVLGITKQSDNPDIYIEMLTFDNDKEKYEKNINEAIDTINSLIKQDKNVIVLDLTNCLRYGEFERRLINNVKLSMILSYSNWNTIANTIGISLSNGLSRYYYLKNNDLCTLADKAYVELSAFAYLKDMVYKAFHLNDVSNWINELTGDKQAYLNYYHVIDKLPNIEQRLYERLENDSKKVLDNLNSYGFIHSLEPRAYVKFDNISIKKYRFVWYRAFECDIEIEVGE